MVWGILVGMIATLRGTVTDKLDQSIVIECAGIGYGVFVPNTTYGDLAPNKEARLFIYEHIREDMHDMYGFLAHSEKRFFEKLLSVNGVGPKMALSIMNLGSSEELAHIIASENVAVLTRASGVGRRLAERIILDLKDTFVDAALMTRAGKPADNEALQALIALGYSQPQAAQALAQIDAKDTKDQVRQALKHLSNV